MLPIHGYPSGYDNDAGEFFLSFLRFSATGARPIPIDLLFCLFLAA